MRKRRNFKTRIYWLVRAAPQHYPQTDTGFLSAVSDATVPLLFKTKKGALDFGPTVRVRLTVEPETR